eukprot:203527_1
MMESSRLVSDGEESDSPVMSREDHIRVYCAPSDPPWIKENLDKFLRGSLPILGKGDLVIVARRCAIGEHCPGGVGVIVEVDPRQLRYDTRFVTGGSEKRVDGCFLKRWSEAEKGRCLRRKKRGRCVHCGSFISDCGHIDQGNYAFTGREGVVDDHDAEPGHYMRTMNKNWSSSDLVGSSVLNNTTSECPTDQLQGMDHLEERLHQHQQFQPSTKSPERMATTTRTLEKQFFHDEEDVLNSQFNLESDHHQPDQAMRHADQTLGSSPYINHQRTNFSAKDIVNVLSRTFVGMNKLGGRARILHFNDDDGTYDVEYVLGGGERRVESRYIEKAIDNEDRCRDTRGRCKWPDCNSFIIHCNHVQPDAMDPTSSEFQSDLPEQWVDHDDDDDSNHGFAFLSTEEDNNSQNSCSSVGGRRKTEKSGGGWQKEVEKGKRKRRRQRVLEDSDSLGSTSESHSESSIGNQKDFEQQHFVRSNARRRAMLQMSVLSSNEEEIEHDDDKNLQRRQLIPELSDNDEEALETVLGPFDRSTFLMPEGEKAAMGLPTDIPNYLSEDSDSILLTSELKKKIEWLSNDGLRNFEKALRNLKSRIWSMHPTEAREEIISLKTFGLHRLVRGGIDIAKWCYRVLDNRSEKLEGKYKCELEVADLRLDPLDSRIDDRLRELRNLERSYGNSLDCKFEIEEVEDEQEESQEIEYEAEETSTKLREPKVEDEEISTSGSDNFFEVKRSEDRGTKDGDLKDDILLSPWKEEDFRMRERTTQAVKKRRRRPDDERGMGIRGHSLLATATVGRSEHRRENKMTQEYYEPFKPFHVRYEERQQRVTAMAMDLKKKKRGMGRRRGHQNKTRGQGHGAATLTGGEEASKRRRRQKSVVDRHAGGTLTRIPKSSRYGMNEGSLSSEEKNEGEEIQVQARREQRGQKMYRSSPHRNPTYLPNFRSLVEDLISFPTNTNRHLPSGGAAKPTTKSSDDNDTAKDVIEPEIWNSDFISAFKSNKTIMFDCIYTQTLNAKIADLSIIALTLKDCKQGLRMERNLRNEPGAIPHILPFRRFIQYKEGSGLVINQSVSNTMPTTSSFNSTTQTEEQNLLVAEEEEHQRRKGCSSDVRHIVPEVFLLLSQVVDHDDVLSSMHIVRACCSAMAVLSHIPISKRWEYGFIDGVKYLTERALRNGGLGKALTQLDVTNREVAELLILNDEEENHKRIPHEYNVLELHCTIRCRLLEWLQILKGDCFIRFSRELLLELLDLYERFPRSFAIQTVAKFLEDKKKDGHTKFSSSSHHLVVISSPIINLWCRLLCCVDNYARDDFKSFWTLFHQTITSLTGNVENKGNMAVESVWSVVIYVMRLYILIGNSSNSDAPPVCTTYNADFWNLVLLLLQVGPLSIGPPGIRKKRKEMNGGGGGITFTLPPEPILPLIYSRIQLERILVLGRYFLPSVSELSCIVTAALKLSSNETLWGAEGSTSVASTFYSTPGTTVFNDHLASTVVDSIIDIDVGGGDLQDQENKLIELKRNLPSLLQKLLQHCRHAVHISVMIPTSQCCCTSSSNSPPYSASYDNDFHPSLRLCGIAMEIYRQRLASESPGLNRRRLHSSLLRTMGELKNRNKALTSRGPLCLAMVMLRWGLLEGGFDAATELLCTSSVGLQPDRKVMLIVPPALEIFSLLQ